MQMLGTSQSMTKEELADFVGSLRGVFAAAQTRSQLGIREGVGR